MTGDPASITRDVYSVSELVDLLRALIEDSLPRVWVQGEISNFSRPASGHWYFTLKDARAQLRCAMFKNANFLVRPQPRDGDAVLVRGRIDIYGARGDLQLIAEHLEPAGEGALLRAFEELKKRLAAEGLFAAALKRAIPPMPHAIGLITSATGAAVQDVLAALSRRFPLASVYLYPVPVQGREAAPAIVHALRTLPRRAPVDVVLLVRGGGSLEDLWAFNEEAVARAIRACAVPVVSGVGHEVDFTIADFVADLRAPTPTAAAELVSPDRAEWLVRVSALQAAQAGALARTLQTAAQRLERATQRLQQLQPQRALQRRAQRLDELGLRLNEVVLRRLLQLESAFGAKHQRLLSCNPRQSIGRHSERLGWLRALLERAVQTKLRRAQDRCQHLSGQLNNLGPQSVLLRGYAIARRQDGTLVREPGSVLPEERLELILARGALPVRRAD
jgi:exodeoxyribonuclease VII large subunit